MLYETQGDASAVMMAFSAVGNRKTWIMHQEMVTETGSQGRMVMRTVGHFFIKSSYEENKVYS